MSKTGAVSTAGFADLAPVVAGAVPGPVVLPLSVCAPAGSGPEPVADSADCPSGELSGGSVTCFTLPFLSCRN